MAKLGTAYVAIEPDFSAFDKMVSRKLAGSFKGAGEQSGKDFGKDFRRGFSAHASGVLVPVSAELADAAKRAGEATAQVKGMDKAFKDAAKSAAAVKPTTAVDLTPLARLDGKLAGTRAEIEKVRARIADLQSQDTTVEVQIDTAKAIAALEKLEKRRNTLALERARTAAAQEPVVVNVDVDTTSIDADVVSSVSEALSELTNHASGAAAALGGGGAGVGGAITRISAGFISFGATLGPIGALLATIAATIGVALVGALAALASSLALAAAGVGALALAVAGVLGPAVVLAIAAVSRLVAIFGALKAQDAAADAVGRNAAAGSAAATAAAEQQAAAARGLTEANRQLGNATSAAYREMEDAAEAASDAVTNLASKQLSLDRAQLSTERAKLELQEYQAELGATGDAFGQVFDKFTDVAIDTSGLAAAVASANDATGGNLDARQELDLRDKILAVREARQREAEAIDGVSDAETNRARTQQRANEFAKQGIGASESYAAALRGVEAASLAVASANRGQGGDLIAAQAKALDLTNDLSGGELRLLSAIKKVRQELRGAFKPATEAVFGGMEKALARVPALVNPLRPAFARLGKTVGSAFDRLSGDLIRPDSIAKLKAFTDGAARLGGPVTRSISALLDVLTDIGRAALPYLVSGAEKVADALEGWAKGTGDAKSLDKVIGNLVDHLKVWLGVAAAIGDVFLAFIVGAAGPGKDLAETIKSLAEETADWLRSDEGREKLAKFFEDTIPLAKQVAGFVADLVVATVKFGQKAAPILKDAFDAFGAVADVVQDVVHWFEEHDTAATILLATVGGFTAAWLAYSVGAGIATVATAAWGAALTAATAVVYANPIGLVIAAIVGLGVALVIAYKRSETFRKIVDGAFNGVKVAATAAYNWIKDHWPLVKNVLTVAFGPLGIIARNFDTLKNAARKALSFIVGGLDNLMGVWSTMLGALGHVPGFGWAKRAADLIDEKLRPALRGVKDALDGINRVGEIEVNVTAKIDKKLKKVLELADAGATVGVSKTPPTRLHRAAGGPVPGFGVGDTVPAMLTPGEYVTRQAIVRRFGMTVFADINAGRLDPTRGYGDDQRPSVGPVRAAGPRFASGGPVTALAEPRQAVNNITAPITVAGGGPPDPRDLGVKLVREVERRSGGSPRQD